MDGPRCSSLLFQLSNDTAINKFLEDISLYYIMHFIFILRYAGPILVLANIFTMFILTRKELRTSYNVVFLVMSLNQSLIILGQDVIIWAIYVNFGCRVYNSLSWVLLKKAIEISYTIFTAHVSFLAVIITYTRFRHLRSNKGEPSILKMTILCFISFIIILLASVPLFLSFDIVWSETLTSCNREDGYLYNITIPVIRTSARTFDNDCLLLRITNFSSGLLFNALPCAVLVFLSGALILELQRIRKNHTDLVAVKSGRTSADTTRSSWMIAMIAIITFLTDVPQAIVHILVGFMSDRFRSTIASNLTILISTLVLIASVCNLSIHLCMSRRCRQITNAYLCCICSKVKNMRHTKLLLTKSPMISKRNT